MSNRLLVTGLAGFIGKNFARYVLENTHYSIHGVDRLDTAARMNDLLELRQRYPKRFDFTWHDLKSTSPIPVEGRFKYIVHLAASSHVTRSVIDPLSFVLDNVNGTAHLLEWVREHHPETKTLYFSTDEVFGPAPMPPAKLWNDVDSAGFGSFGEYAAHEPNNPYAATKAAAEALVPAWANTYGMPLVVSHCTNVYGPAQDKEKFIPLVKDKVLRDAMVQIHARNGVPSSRYYVYVDNISTAILTILEKGGTWGGPNTGKYNISGPQEFSNLYVAERIAEHLGKPLKYELVEFVPDRPRHDQRYAINSTRLEQLGWKPHVDFEEGLRLSL